VALLDEEELPQEAEAAPAPDDTDADDVHPAPELVTTGPALPPASTDVPPGRSVVVPGTHRFSCGTKTVPAGQFPWAGEQRVTGISTFPVGVENIPTTVEQLLTVWAPAMPGR
jgi:hypothetical protein